MPADHLNVIERSLIDAFRNPSSSPWASGAVTVFGQFPETEDIKYPCIIVEHVANGLETQFMGQKATFGSGSSATDKTAELYGVGFDIWIACDKETSLDVVPPPGTGSAVKYKQRRLMNYMELQVANILMDLDFETLTPYMTEVTDRHFQGFRNINYNAQLEVWSARTSMMIVFKNYRGNP